MALQITKVDDQDPAFSYSPGDWTLGGSGNEFMNTTMRTVKLGASMRISFTGTKITVYGSLGSSSKFGKTPTSLFSVDNGRAQQFIGTQDDDVSLYQQKFYESPDLEYAPHVLLATISDVPSNIASFVVDYAEITNLELQPSDSSSSTLLTSSSSSGIPETSLFSTLLPTTPSIISIASSSIQSSTLSTGSPQGTFVAVADAASHPRVSAPIIAAAVIIGCLTLLLLLLVIQFYLCLRKRRFPRDVADDAELNAPPSPQPRLSVKVQSHLRVLPFIVHNAQSPSSPGSVSTTSYWTAFRTSNSPVSAITTSETYHRPKGVDSRGLEVHEEDPPSYDSLH